MLSLVEDCAAGDVGEGSGHGTSPIRGHKGGYLAQLVQRLTGSTGEKHFSPFAGKCAGHRAADRASPSVDYGVLVLKQHLGTPLLVVRTGLHIMTQRLAYPA